MMYSLWRQNSNGGLGVFGPHTTIFPFLALKLRELWENKNDGKVIRATAECSRTNRVSFPRWERVHWEIPATAGRPALAITWHNGPDYPAGSREQIHEKMRRFGVSSEEEADELMGYTGSMIIGSEGAKTALIAPHIVTIHRLLTLPEAIDINDGNQVVQLVVAGNRYRLPHRSLRGFAVSEQDINAVVQFVHPRGSSHSGAG
ncbi:MAG: hypothetical protein WD490_11095 [Opitutales bacterium]